jgi:hypothetical protein
MHANMQVRALGDPTAPAPPFNAMTSDDHAPLAGWDGLTDECNGSLRKIDG